MIPTVIRKGPSVLELLSGEDQSLLIRGDTLLVLDLGFDIVDGVGGLDLEGDGLARKAIDQRGFMSILHNSVFHFFLQVGDSFISFKRVYMDR